MRLYPLYHPAAALYTPSMLEILRTDFQRIPELLALDPPPTARAAGGGARGDRPRAVAGGGGASSRPSGAGHERGARTRLSGPRSAAPVAAEPAQLGLF